MATPKEQENTPPKAKKSFGEIDVIKIKEDPSIIVTNGFVDTIREIVKDLNDIKIYSFEWKMSKELENLFATLGLDKSGKNINLFFPDFIYKIFSEEITDRIFNIFTTVFSDYFSTKNLTKEQFFKSLSSGLKIETRNANAKKEIDDEILKFNSEDINTKIANKIFDEFYKDPSIALDPQDPGYQYLKNKPKLLGFYDSSNSDFTNVFQFNQERIISFYKDIFVKYTTYMVYDKVKETFGEQAAQLYTFTGIDSNGPYAIYTDQTTGKQTKYTIDDIQKDPNFYSQLVKITKELKIIAYQFVTNNENFITKNLIEHIKQVKNFYRFNFYESIKFVGGQDQEPVKGWMKFFGEVFDNLFASFIADIDKFSSIFTEEELDSIKFGGNKNINKNPKDNKNLIYNYTYDSIDLGIVKQDFYNFYWTAIDLFKKAPALNITNGNLKWEYTWPVQIFIPDGPMPSGGPQLAPVGGGPGSDYSVPGGFLSNAKQGIKVYAYHAHVLLFEYIKQLFDDNYQTLLDYYKEINDIRISQVDPFLDVFFNGAKVKFPTYSYSEYLKYPKYYGRAPDLSIDLLYNKKVDIYKNKNPKVLFTFKKPQLLSHEKITPPKLNKEGKNNYKPSDEQKLINSLQPTKIFVYRTDSKISNLTPDLLNNETLIKELDVYNKELSFYDNLEPNKDYYYFYLAKFTDPTGQLVYNMYDNYVIIEGEDLYWICSPIIKINLVKDSTFYYLEVDYLVESDLVKNEYEETFKNKISITPKSNSFDFGGNSFAAGQDSFIKIRVTSSKTRKKIDLNLKYTLNKDKKNLTNEEFSNSNPVSVETLDDQKIKKLIKNKFKNEDVTSQIKFIITAEEPGGADAKKISTKSLTEIDTKLSNLI